MGEENLSNNNSQKPSLIDQLAPNFLLTTLNGETFNLSEVIKNRRAMIYFWATWCPNCLKKLQYFSESAEMFEQQNIALVIINYGEEKERVVEYINQYNIDLNIVLDQEKSLQKSYDLNSLPTLIFINSEGLIKNIKHDLDLHNL
ncbi:MAG: redoxin domain-containing protein [Candidatus Omnitrophica bacterium]|nr:redoxin domain-containing protein [Candidatus Omnitrophota bacterium]